MLYNKQLQQNMYYGWALNNLYTRVQMIKLPTTLLMEHFAKKQQIDSKICPCDPQGMEDGAILSKLKILASTEDRIYPVSFMANYLLIKINNLLCYGEKELSHFAIHLVMYYNNLVSNGCLDKFRQGKSDQQLMAQVLLTSRTYRFLTPSQLNQVLNSNGLVTVTMIQTFRILNVFLGRSEYVVTMGLVGLHARINPFLPIVHHDKNHAGEIRFAARILQLIHLHPSVEKPNLDIVQDAYSLRCTPQVHGVVYELIQVLQKQLGLSINKPQGRFINEGGKKMVNLLYRSQSDILLLDSVACGLNQIGHMSFLRTERMLNRFLTKNKIENSESYSLMLTKLKKVSVLVSLNRKMMGPTNADTVIMDNYAHDIFVDQGSPYTKIRELIDNLNELLKLELSVAIEVLHGLYGEKAIFVNQQMQELYTFFLIKRGEGDFLNFLSEIGQWMKK